MRINKKQQEQLQALPRHFWWRSPLLGYPLAVLFAAAAFAVPIIQRTLGIQDPFIEPPFVIAVLLVGWFWGIGPVLLALLLEILALDYWIVPPVGVIDFFLEHNDIVSFTSFTLLQLVVLSLVITQKNYRQQLLHAKQA